MAPALLPLRVGALGLVLAASLPVQAQGNNEHGHTWMTVGDRTLAHMRGGFSFGNGLLVTIGISRALYINGALITESTLNLGQVAQLNATQAAQLSQQLQALSLVQNGPGNVFVSAPAVVAAQAVATVNPAAGPSNAAAPNTTAAPSNAAAPNTAAGPNANVSINSTLPTATAIISAIPNIGPGLVIQNSLSNQSIINRTTIDASSNALSMLLASRLQTEINNAVQQAINGR